MSDFSLKWSPAFATGLPLVDREHQDAMALLGMAYDACLRAVKPEALAKLKAYRLVVTAHYAREEEIMERERFPDIDRHRRAHMLMHKKLNDSVCAAEDADLPQIRVLLKDLARDFISHMVGDDLFISGHMQRTGTMDVPDLERVAKV